MSSLQIGVCNGIPVVIDVPEGGLLPINYKVVELRYDFYKDAPSSYRPYKFVNRFWWSPSRWKTWHTRNGPDKAGWLYPYMAAEADALVALNLAYYYVGPPVDVDHRGRPAP